MTITSPIYLELPRKTKKNVKKALNLNVYRNLHFIVNNQMKILYKEKLLDQLYGLSFGKIKLTFVLFKASRRKIDRSNFCSIVEKFFCDALVELGCIPDDRDEYIISTHYFTGGVDPANPRCEIIIEEVKESETSNYVKLTEGDLFNAD